jgi:glycosyltransferase involved in cell wall biosynthesis
LGKTKRIDILIPAYHAQETIAKTLASIAMQTISDKANVFICNDAGGDNYAEIIDSFSPYLDIKEIVLPHNGGCGVARQFGIDHSHAEYFMCIDADDTLDNCYALQTLLNYIDGDPARVLITSAFAEEMENGEFVKHHNDMIWMHGKIYRRAFAEKYGLRFNETRACEDVGFNTVFALICDEETEQVRMVEETTYCWQFHGGSITRAKNAEYTYNQAFTGFADNISWAVKRIREIKRGNKVVEIRADILGIRTMADLYLMYIQCLHRAPQFSEQNFKRSIKYYDETFREISGRTDREKVDAVVAQVIEDKISAMKKVVPDFGFWEFIDKLHNAQIELAKESIKNKQAKELEA